MTEIQIKQGWKEVQLGEIVKFQYGFTASSSNKK
jgi:hypothetical protein